MKVGTAKPTHKVVLNRLYSSIQYLITPDKPYRNSNTFYSPKPETPDQKP